MKAKSWDVLREALATFERVERAVSAARERDSVKGQPPSPEEEEMRNAALAASGEALAFKLRMLLQRKGQLTP